MDVIDRLIAAVKRSGYKPVRIAADAGMRPEKLSKILNRKQVPTVPEFIDIARAIRMDPARLFTDSELVVELDALRAAHSASVRVTETLAGMLPDVPSITAAAANPNAPSSWSSSKRNASRSPGAPGTSAPESSPAWSATRWTAATIRSRTASSPTSSRPAAGAPRRTRSIYGYVVGHG